MHTLKTMRDVKRNQKVTSKHFVASKLHDYTNKREKFYQVCHIQLCGMKIE